MLVLDPTLAWVICLPVCALLGALVQLFVPRDWPKASLGVAYVSLGSAAIFALRGVLSIPATGELSLLNFGTTGLPLAFALSANRMAWCLIALVLAGCWIALQARGGRHGQDAAMAGCWLGLGAIVVSLSANALLDAIGLGLAIGVLWVAGAPGQKSGPAKPAHTLGLMLLVASVLLSLISLWLARPDLPLEFTWAEAVSQNAPLIQHLVHYQNVADALSLILAARVLAFAVIVGLLWRCKPGLERGQTSRWFPLVVFALGVALVKPVPPLALLPIEMAPLPIALWGLGLAAAVIVVLCLYTMTKAWGFLGVAAELLNQVPMLLVEFTRMLIMLPIYKARGKRIVFKTDPKTEPPK